MRCTLCGYQWHLDGEQRLITTQALTKACKGAGSKGSPPLSEFFKKKSETSSTAADALTSQPLATESQPQVENRPTPRRLHFHTQLDEREELTQEEDDDGSTNMTVDFF